MVAIEKQRFRVTCYVGTLILQARRARRGGGGARRRRRRRCGRWGWSTITISSTGAACWNVRYRTRANGIKLNLPPTVGSGNALIYHAYQRRSGAWELTTTDQQRAPRSAHSCRASLPFVSIYTTTVYKPLRCVYARKPLFCNLKHWPVVGGERMKKSLRPIGGPIARPGPDLF